MNNENQIIHTLINALKNPATAMAASVINSARRDHPVLFNRALSQYNNMQRQANRPLSSYQPVTVTNQPNPTAAAPAAPAAAPAAPAVIQQTVNISQDEPVDDLDSLDDEESGELDFAQLDEVVVQDSPIDPNLSGASEEDESIEDEDEETSDTGEDIADIEEDFEDDEMLEQDDTAALDEGFALDADDSEFVSETEPEPIPTIENLTFRHSLSLSLYLNDEEGSIYEKDGKWFSTKQPLRRGKGVDGDAAGAVRVAMESFVEGVKAEGEGIRFAIAVTDNIVDEYVRTLNNDIEARLSSNFDVDSNADVTVTSVIEQAENPWGGDNARIVHREIALRFSVPAIVSSARKQKDEVKMLLSNLKIVNNIVRALKETGSVENVQVNILIADNVAVDLLNIYTHLIGDGSVPKFDRGYARFTVQSSDAAGDEAE